MGTGNLTTHPEEKARQALLEELQRQAADNPERLRLDLDGDRIRLEGEVDSDALVMVVIGAVAGGP